MKSHKESGRFMNRPETVSIAEMRHSTYTARVVTMPEEVELDTFWQARIHEIERRERTKIGPSRVGGFRVRAEWERVAFHNARGPGDGDLSVRQWEQIKERFSVCAYCENPVATHLEHVVPVSRGGPSSWNNIVPACRVCNKQKGDMDPWEWLGDGPMFARFVEKCLEASEL